MAYNDRMWFIGRLCFAAGFLLVFSLVTTGVAVAQNPVPLINQPLVPDAVEPGGAGFTLTVNGTGFASGAIVNWNGSARATTFVSRSRLTATILASDITTAHTSSVTVVNPMPGGATSNVVFFPVTRPSSSIALGPPKEYTTGYNGAASVLTADVNGDGRLDLVVANSRSNSVSVILGNGDGTFQPPVGYGVGSGPYSVGAGDFNGDGRLDLVVANNGSNDVSVLLGNGDGTFQGAVNYPGGSGPRSVAVGDFNGDGRLDVAVANYGSNAVSVLLGNGNGTFQAPVGYGVGSGPYSVGVGDFNGDGRLDLVVANYGSNDVSVLLANGDGTFQGAVNYPGGSGPWSVAVGDFNGDGRLDVAVANYGNGAVSVFLGNGNGTFQPAVSYGGGAAQNATSVAVGDFNGDGKLDLIVTLSGPNVVGVLLGAGDGTFQPAAYYVAQGLIPFNPTSVAVGDFNGDGRLEPAVSDDQNGAVSILLQVPTVSVSETSLTFGNQVVGRSSASQTVTISNTSGLALNISSIAVTGTNATDFRQGDTCGSVLLPGGQCTITLTFAPTQTGPRTASVNITDDAAGSPQAIALSGTGVVSGPNATLSPTSLTFATQLVGTTSPAQSVTITDYGTATLSITSIVVGGDFSQTNTCGSSLASGASCTINVTFKPTQSGIRTGTVSITDNAPASPRNVGLTGTGTVVELNPANLTFGAVQIGQSKNLSTTLTNVGSTPLSPGITVAGHDIDEFSQVNTCGSSVGAGQSCTISVTFKPTEQGGDSADLSISDKGGSSPQQVPLSGTGCVYNPQKHKCLTTLNSPAVQSALAKSATVVAPRSTGSNSIGTRVLDLVDSGRNDPFLANGTHRELLVRFWYPASSNQACRPAEYTSPKVWNYFSELTELPLPQVTTNSCLDARVANGAHPVVIFTHGYTGTFTDYTFLFEDLASRGYFVASIDHTYEATAVEFPDGRVVKSLVGSHLANSWRTDDQSLSFALSVRLDDLRFVLNELERLNTSSDSEFAGKLDLMKVALAGHSLGGLATWLGVQQDNRFKAAILLDPYLAYASLSPTETPVMMLAMGHEQRSEEECRLWSDLLGPRFSANLRGAEHLTPSDAVWLAKGTIKSGAMGPDKTIAAVRDYVAAFLDANLLGRSSDRLLTGPSSNYPDAAVTARQEQLCSGSTGKQSIK